MGKTNIEWADYTFNPFEGCTKVSPGCAHCYAETRNHRFGNDNWGKGKPRRRASAAYLKLPWKWDLEAAKELADWNQHSDLHGGFPHYDKPRRPRVSASLADWLDDEVPIEWLADLLKLIHDTPNLDWLLLTKRPENFFARTRAAIACARGKNGPDELTAIWCPHNIWLGVSVEDQQRADERIPELLKIPGRIRFLSVEPMIGPIDFSKIHFKDEDADVEMNCLTGETWVTNSASPSAYDHSAPKIHWAIFGGESGKSARPCNIDWIRDGVKQCQAAGVAPFVKQLGAHPIGQYFPGKEWSAIRDLHESGMVRDKKGADPSEWPADLRIQQWPEQRK